MGTTPHELMIEMEDMEGVVKRALYKQFKVSDKTEHSFEFKGFEMQPGFEVPDALAIHNKLKFATRDEDNDGKCAELTGAPGWFNGDPERCFTFNPFGVHLKSRSASAENGVVYQPFGGWKNSLKRLVMSVKIVGERYDQRRLNSLRHVAICWLIV